MKTHCENCKSARLENALLEGAAVQLERAATMKKVLQAGGQMRCRVCLDCGALSDLRVDPQEMARMLT